MAGQRKSVPAGPAMDFIRRMRPDGYRSNEENLRGMMRSMEQTGEISYVRLWNLADHFQDASIPYVLYPDHDFSGKYNNA